MKYHKKPNMDSEYQDTNSLPASLPERDVILKLNASIVSQLKDGTIMIEMEGFLEFYSPFSYRCIKRQRFPQPLVVQTWQEQGHGLVVGTTNARFSEELHMQFMDHSRNYL